MGIANLRVSDPRLHAGPSAMRKAASKLSARRLLQTVLHLDAIDHDVESCFSDFFTSADPTASTPCRRPESAQSLAPACRQTNHRTRLLRSRTTGASTISRVSAGSASTASTIWLTLCARSGTWCSGQ